MFATQDPWQSPAAPVPQQSSGSQTLAIASIVVGLVSMPAIFCCSCIASPLPVVGLGLGAYALFEARKHGNDQVMAAVGTGLNGLALLMMAGFFAFAIATNSGDMNNVFDEMNTLQELEESTIPAAPEVPESPESPSTP